MPMLPGPIASGGVDAGVDTTTSSGINVTASGTANAKGAWSEAIAALTYEAGWLIVGLRPSAAAAYLVDIGVGAAGSERVVVPNLMASAGALAAQGGKQFAVPLSVARGERIAVRCQSSTASAAIRVGISVVPPTLLGEGFCSRCEALGANLTATRGHALDPGASINVLGAYGTMGTTTFAWKWVNMTFGFREQPASASDATWLVDLAWGASNVIAVPKLTVSTDTSTDESYATYKFPCAIPSGQAVKVRAQCSINNATDRILDTIIYGSG